MKFSQVGDFAFMLPFFSQQVDRILITVSATEYLALLETQIHVDEGDRRGCSYQLLRATFQLNMIKCTCDEDGDLFLVAQIPIELLDRYVLEGLVRALAVLADISPHCFGDAVVVGGAAERASAILRAYCEMSSESRSGQPAAELMPDIAKELGGNVSRISNTVFAIEGSPLQARILAECHDHQVSLRVLYKSLTPAPEDGAFFHEMAVANHRLRVAKFSLNEDDHLSLSYEVPFLSPQAFGKGVEIINTSLGALSPLTARLQQ
jgi:hypothetical protein